MESNLVAQFMSQHFGRRVLFHIVKQDFSGKDRNLCISSSKCYRLLPLLHRQIAGFTPP